MQSPFFAFPFEIILPTDERIPRRGEVSMESLPGGDVLIAYANHRAGAGPDGKPLESDNTKADLCMQRLSAKGKPIGAEWTCVVAPADVMNVMSPALRRLPDGRLAMAYSWRRTTKEACRHMIFSGDEGKTWTDPVVVGAGAYVTGCHDRLTLLSDGRMLAPLHCSDDWDRHYLHVRVARSDDQGQTWQMSAPVELPPVGGPDWYCFIESGCVEPSVAERADGSLLLSLRTAMGSVFGAESFDRGETWTHPRSLEVASPQAPSHLSRIPGTDDLLLIWTPNYDANVSLGGKRRTLMACVSRDGGRSWPHAMRRRLAHTDTDQFDYPAVLYRDGDVWVSFRQHLARPDGNHIQSGLMKLPLRWLYEGGE